MDRVPDDVLRVILDEFCFSELVRIMRVSSRWHALIVDLPEYWRDIWLQLHRGTASSAIGLFLRRMRRSSTQRPIRVCFQSYSMAPPPAVVTAIAEHLHHTQTLSISVPMAFSAGILAFFTRPAPMLEELAITLELGREEEALPTLSLPLFACHAPLLRTVSLTNVLCPAEGYPLFAQVERADMAYRTSEPAVVMPNPTAVFPAARRMTLEANDIWTDDSIYDPASWRNVEILELSGRALWGRLRLALEAIPHIAFIRWNPGCVAMALDHIRQRLELQLELSYEPCVTMLTTHIKGLNGSRTLARSFIRTARDWLETPEPSYWPSGSSVPLTEDWPNSLFKHGPLIARIVTLRISSEIFLEALLQLFDPLPVLETLILEDFVDFPRSPSTLPCPNLRALVLVGSPELCRPTQEEVDEFIRVCLITGRLPLRVESRNFTIDPSDWRGADPSFIVIANEAAGAEQ
ncbi:hypothetical protein EXIGLDRAFT_694386 [Exidia glandulosa HHB12029]|uniref:F-box domain-containing protein n=1 Tax=Exidia glandulosa HHB12029 TaxID=1314781 RepID=A0A165NP84_EXIGL|nr:hypothetical protein EXIGLDRAFT_694386 [Exidia glandulosa HHB12029]